MVQLTNESGLRALGSPLFCADICRTQTYIVKCQVARRPRESPFPMISVTDAQAKVLEFCNVLGSEKVSFTQALGRVLAQDVFAREPLPPFPASTKDG